jgi:hypothetical protein
MRSACSTVLNCTCPTQVGLVQEATQVVHENKGIAVDLAGGRDGWQR